MTYKIDFSENREIVHLSYVGAVTIEERKKAVFELINNDAIHKPLKVLVNVEALEMHLSLQEQQAFGEYLASHPELNHAKVAVLHKPEYNPNLLIDVSAFNNGYRIAEFCQLKEAELWLKEA